MRAESNTNSNQISVSGLPGSSAIVDASNVIAQIVDATSGAFTGNAGNYGASISGTTITFNQSELSSISICGL